MPLHCPASIMNGADSRRILVRLTKSALSPLLPSLYPAASTLSSSSVQIKNMISRTTINIMVKFMKVLTALHPICSFPLVI